MTLRSQKLEIVFELGTLVVHDVAMRALAALDLGNDVVELYGKRGTQSEVVEQVKAAKKPHFKIKTGKGVLHFATATAYKVHLLEIREDEGVQVRRWETIAECFLGETGLIQACASDVEFAFWQSASDPLQYEAAGRSYANLPMISNGLPAPLTQRIIDVSRNPARRVLRVGFVEMIGHVMWFGPKFWGIVGQHRRESILCIAGCRAIEFENGVLRIDAAGGPFVDETTRAGQVALRRALFE